MTISRRIKLLLVFAKARSYVQIFDCNEKNPFVCLKFNKCFKNLLKYSLKKKNYKEAFYHITWIELL